MRRALIFLIFFLLALSISGVHSDMVFIPTSIMDIQEPVQIAVITWNDGVEVMLFGVNIIAAEGIKGIGLMPLPSKPEVYLGSNKSFEIIDKFVTPRGSTLGIPAGDIGVSVEFNMVLGPHNVTCLKITYDASAEEIRNNLLRIATENNLDTLAITDQQIQLLQSYASMGYEYFLVDIINAENYTSGFLPPLIIKFRSDKVWYPLRISRLYKGEMYIGVMVITPRAFTCDSRLYWDMKYNRIIERSTIEKMDPHLASIFSPLDRWFRIYVFKTITFPSYLYDDFVGHVHGVDINIYYYLIIFMLTAIIIIFGAIPHIPHGAKKEKTINMKTILLVSGHLAIFFVLWVLLISGYLFTTIPEYKGTETPPLVDMYICSLMLTNIILVILLILILYRLVGYVKTGDTEYLTEKHIGTIAILTYIFILLISLMAVIKLYSDFSWWYAQELVTNTIIMLVFMYTSIAYVANIALRKRGKEK